MKTIEELKRLYESDLKPQLEDIESQRIIIKRYFSGGLTLLIFVFFFNNLISNQGIRIACIIAALLALLFLFGYGVVKFYNYRRVFKKEVVSKIIKLINPNYYYNVNRHVSGSHFYDSKLFSKEADRFQGDDFVSGTIEKTDFEFSELRAEYKSVSTEDGKKETKWYRIFSGLFFHADFNKHIVGNTFVLPDTAEKLLGKIGQKLQRGSQRGELVKLENPEFEKEFVVYSTGQQEARYILTPVMMESMVNIQKEYNRKMRFSFTGSRVYCAISYSKGLFEPRIRKSGVNFNDIEEMYRLFGLIETIIQEMNLNTRIWTKK